MEIIIEEMIIAIFIVNLYYNFINLLYTKNKALLSACIDRPLDSYQPEHKDIEIQVL